MYKVFLAVVLSLMLFAVPAHAFDLFGAQGTVEIGAAKLFSVNHTSSIEGLSTIDNVDLSSPRDQVLFSVDLKVQKNSIFGFVTDYALMGNVVDKDGGTSWGIGRNLFMGGAGYMFTPNVGVKAGYASWMTRSGVAKDVSPYVFSQIFLKF